MTRSNVLASLSGFGYAIIFVCGFYANFYVLEQIRIPGDANQTASLLIDRIDDFNTAFAAFGLMVLADLLLAFPLYSLFQAGYKRLALLSSNLRVINAFIFGVALISLHQLSQLLNPDTVLGPELIIQTNGLLAKFDQVWLIGLLFFGAHLLLLGWLAYQRPKFPKIIAVFLSLAGIGYLLDSTLQLTWTSYTEYKSVLELMVIVPGVLGELSLTIWLLVMGLLNRVE